MLHARHLLDPGEQHDHDHRFGWSRSAGLADHDDRNPQRPLWRQLLWRRAGTNWPTGNIWYRASSSGPRHWS